MAKDVAWGGEAISQMSQQELKIIPQSPNHGKTVLITNCFVLPPSCNPSPRRSSGGCRAILVGAVRRNAIQGLLPDGQRGFWGTTVLWSAQVAYGGSRATGFLLQCVCEEVQVSVAGLWPERRLVLWLRWKVSLFFCRTSLHKEGTSFHKTTRSAPKKKKKVLTGLKKTNLPPASAAACQRHCPQKSHRGGTGVTGGVAVATSPGVFCSEMVWHLAKHGGCCRKRGSALPALERATGVPADPY